VFVVFGAVGCVWAAAWWWWFRDDPEEHPAVNAAERAYIKAGRSVGHHHPLTAGALRQLLSDRSMVALCLMYFTQAYGFYFNITWLPTYLARDRGITAERFGVAAAVLAGLPLILSAVADVVGGLTTDRITRAKGLRAGRCGVGFVSLLVAGVALIAGATARDAVAAALLIALSGAAASFLLGSCWGVCQDIAGPHAGLVAGCMNTAGQLGAVLSPVVLPLFQDPTYPLCLAGGLYLAGAACWLFVDPTRTITIDEV
jgi:nitrate/nitrite transporter NarK